MRKHGVVCTDMCAAVHSLIFLPHWPKSLLMAVCCVYSYSFSCYIVMTCVPPYACTNDLDDSFTHPHSVYQKSICSWQCSQATHFHVPGSLCAKTLLCFLPRVELHGTGYQNCD